MAVLVVLAVTRVEQTGLQRRCRQLAIDPTVFSNSAEGQGPGPLDSAVITLAMLCLRQPLHSLS